MDRERGAAVEIVKVEDQDAILSHRITAMPAVIIDGHIMHSDGLPSHAEMQGWQWPASQPMGSLSQAT